MAAACAAPGPQNQREPSDRGPEEDGPSRSHRQASAAMRWLASVQPRPGVTWVFRPSYVSDSSGAPAVRRGACLAGDTSWPGVLAGLPLATGV